MGLLHDRASSMHVACMQMQCVQASIKYQHIKHVHSATRVLLKACLKDVKVWAYYHTGSIVLKHTPCNTVHTYMYLGRVWLAFSISYG